MVDIPFRFPPEGPFSAVELAALGRQGLLAINVGGFNPDVDMVAAEDIWAFGGIRTWLQAAAPLVARSTNANDTAAGTGARTVDIVGLDISGTLITETLTMAGLANSAATSQSFFRQNNAVVGTVGTYGGTNLGDITIETSPGAVVQSFIRTGVSRQENTHITVPNNFLALVFGPNVAIESQKTAFIRINTREDGDVIVAPFAPMERFFEFPGVEGVIALPVIVPIPLFGFTDIWFEAQGSGQNAQIQISYGLILVPR